MVEKIMHGPPGLEELFTYSYSLPGISCSGGLLQGAILFPDAGTVDKSTSLRCDSKLFHSMGLAATDIIPHNVQLSIYILFWKMEENHHVHTTVFFYYA